MATDRQIHRDTAQRSLENILGDLLMLSGEVPFDGNRSSLCSTALISLGTLSKYIEQERGKPPEAFPQLQLTRRWRDAGTTN